MVMNSKREKKSSGIRKGDLLDQFVDDIKKETFLSDEFIVFILFGVLFASFETISSTIALAIKFLTENPSIMQELVVSNNI